MEFKEEDALVFTPYGKGNPSRGKWQGGIARLRDKQGKVAYFCLAADRVAATTVAEAIQRK